MPMFASGTADPTDGGRAADGQSIPLSRQRRALGACPLTISCAA
jgi:hypothetical protein